MEPVDVLRPLALGQVPLGPREVEVDVGVERVLGRGHPRQFDAEVRKPRPPAPAGRSERPITSKETSSPADLRMPASQASAAHRSRRCFSSSTISSGSPKRAPELLLHLAEDQPPAAPDDDVELVTGHPDVLRQDAVAAQAVPPDRAPLGALASTPVHAATLRGLPRMAVTNRRAEVRRTAPPAPPRSGSRAPGRNGGGCATGRARARSSSDRA